MTTAEKLPKKYYSKIQKKNLKRINMDLPQDLWDRITDQAIDENIAKRELVIYALEEYLQKERMI